MGSVYNVCTTGSDPESEIVIYIYIYIYLFAIISFLSLMDVCLIFNYFVLYMLHRFHYFLTFVKEQKSEILEQTSLRKSFEENS